MNEEMPNEENSIKTRLHERNRNNLNYDFVTLCNVEPSLKGFVHVNKYGVDTINFSDPVAVKMLNKAILKSDYSVEFWDVPEGYLCPPIPGRADYLHHAADLLGKLNYNTPPKGKRIKCLDIGTGANCIYPLIGVVEYGWKFVGTDTDEKAVAAAIHNVKMNPLLKHNIAIKEQGNAGSFFEGIIGKDDFFDLTICNPPFHASAKEAKEASMRKNSRLKKGTEKPVLNFGGQSNELWCEGGEVKFVGDMIKESKSFGEKCLWFTSLVSKKGNLKTFYAILKQEGAAKVETIAMGQGNKSSRILAWTFLAKDDRLKWRKERWA